MADDHDVWRIAFRHLSEAFEGLVKTLEDIPNSQKPLSRWNQIGNGVDKLRSAIIDVNTVHDASRYGLLVQSVDNMADQVESIKKLLIDKQ